jgi:hypothetical protein
MQDGKRSPHFGQIEGILIPTVGGSRPVAVRRRTSGTNKEWLRSDSEPGRGFCYYFRLLQRCPWRVRINAEREKSGACGTGSGYDTWRSVIYAAKPGRGNLQTSSANLGRCTANASIPFPLSNSCSFAASFESITWARCCACPNSPTNSSTVLTASSNR